MNVRRWVFGGRWRALASALSVLAALVLLRVPAALAFPYHARMGATRILSDRPIDPAIARVLARSDRLLAASPGWRPGASRQLVLTDGGWRWRVLAIGLSGAVALRRPLSDALIFNSSNVAQDRVTNGALIGGTRSLSGTIAHETTHLLVAQHVGEWRLAQMPAWKREGYADVIARESSLGRDDEARIRKMDPGARVLIYYEGRRRVAAELRRNGGSLDMLFSD